MKTYLAGKKTKFYSLCFTLFVFVFGIFAILVYFIFLPGRMDPQGEASANCIKKELLSIPNGSGMVASAYQTTCNNSENDSAVYVHLHKQGTIENSHSLIFRYAAYPNTPAPKIEWRGNSLSISVGNFLHVTKSIPSKDGIKINYTTGKEDANWVKRNQSRWARVEVAVFLFLVLILLVISSYKIINLIKESS